MRTLAAVAALLVVAGCGTATTGARGGAGPAVASGIRGTTSSGPACPVQRPGSSCSHRPIRAVISVTRPRSAATVGSTTTDRAGRFQLKLPPGSYLLVARTLDPLPNGGTQRRSVTVTDGAFTKVAISFDSGIR
jgi:hypothetical protein